MQTSFSFLKRKVECESQTHSLWSLSQLLSPVTDHSVVVAPGRQSTRIITMAEAGKANLHLATIAELEAALRVRRNELAAAEPTDSPTPAPSTPEEMAAAFATMTPADVAAALSAMSAEDRAVALPAMSPSETAAALAAMSPSLDCLAAQLLNSMSPEDRAATVAAMSPAERLSILAAVAELASAAAASAIDQRDVSDGAAAEEELPAAPKETSKPEATALTIVLHWSLGCLQARILAVCHKVRSLCQMLGNQRAATIEEARDLHELAKARCLSVQ